MNSSGRANIVKCSMTMTMTNDEHENEYEYEYEHENEYENDWLNDPLSFGIGAKLSANVRRV